MATGRLAGKSCAVTSAARGIGRGIAIRLAAEGAHVAVVDLDFDGAQQVVDDMGEAMLRTSFSQILNSSRDFSTAITDAGGRLVAQAEYIPVHVGAMPASVLATLEAFGDAIHPGDVFLRNDPYFGGSQLPDLTACLPARADRSPGFRSTPRPVNPPVVHRGLYREPPSSPYAVLRQPVCPDSRHWIDRD